MHVWYVTETEQYLLGTDLPLSTSFRSPPLLCIKALASGLLPVPKNKFNQKSQKMARTKENSQARQNNNSLAIKTKLKTFSSFSRTIEGFPHSSVGKESACNAGDPGSIFGSGKIHWRSNRLFTAVFLGFPCGSAGKESDCNAGDLGLIPGLGRSPGEGKGYPLQCSGLENSMDCIVQGSQRVGHDWATFTRTKDKIPNHILQ